MFGTILVDIAPLTLVEKTDLRCFGEIYGEKLARYVKIFLRLSAPREGVPIIWVKIPSGQARPASRTESLDP